MKKLILCTMILFTLVGCGQKKVFIEDLHTTPNDMTSYTTITEPSSHFLEISLNESLRLFQEGGSGILMISRSSCPHCLNAVPVMNEVAQKHDLTVYYVDCEKSFEMEDFELLEDYLSEVLGRRDLLVPIVVSIINGKAVDQHIGTIPEEDGLLNDEQKNKAIQIYEEMLADWIK